TDAEAWRKAEAKNPATIPVDADTAPAAATMNAFIDSWTKGITVPVAVVPGQGAPGQNPLDIFAPGGPGFSVGGAKGPPALGGGGNSLGKRDSGGVMQPNAAATKSYFEGLGFTVGGYSP